MFGKQRATPLSMGIGGLPRRVGVMSHRRAQGSTRAGNAVITSGRGIGLSPSVSRSRPIFTAFQHFEFRDGNLGLWGGRNGDRVVGRADLLGTVFDTAVFGVATMGG
jgi:hypothetical protein